MEFNLIDRVKEASLEMLLGKGYEGEQWIWLSRDLLKDFIGNILDYDSFDDQELEEAVTEHQEELFTLMIKKLKEAGWVSISPKLFAVIHRDFPGTTDGEISIFLQRQYYLTHVMSKIRAWEWCLRAMAVDTYQQLNPEGISLESIYEEHFSNNYRMLELLLEGQRVSHLHGTWRIDLGTHLLYFYKGGKELRQWAETHGNSVFKELSQ